MRLLRRWKRRRARRRWQALAAEAREWERALTYLGPSRALLRVERIRQNARTGQKFYFREAIRRGPATWDLGEERAGWVWGRQYKIGTWLGINIATNNGGRGWGSHHDEEVLYIRDVQYTVPDSARLAWERVSRSATSALGYPL
ncbi:MAG: hypothetical protein KY460_17755 [Actinobacteria bacterium]|nr:hypothetical protein [Actinomycetota bacterium]